MSRLVHLAAVLHTLLPTRALANQPVFDGPDNGLEEGLRQAQQRVGLNAAGDAEDTIVDIVARILDFVGLAAVIVIIIAGIMLIVGMGSEDSRDRAKRIVLYTIIGLFLIILSRVIVMTVGNVFTDLF